MRSGFSIKSSIRFFSSVFFTGLLFSCSNAAQDSAAIDESPTLRYTANSLYESTIWTEEIETDRLSSQVTSVSGVSSKLNLSPLIVLAGVQSESSRIFPSLGSFGSLDTTLISKSLRETLTSFSDCIAKYKDADTYFVKDSLYSISLFYNDFKRIFGECFELDKIQENPKAESVSSGEKSASSNENELPSSKEDSDSESKESENPEPAAVEKSYFTSFVFGQPFLDGVYYEVPVKFFSDKATLTLSVFCFENAGVWKIDQVQIADWEIFNDE